MIGGWFVGSFEPNILHTDDVEVAVKKYKEGDREGRHYHKIATEVTIVLSGRVLMNGESLVEGDIVTIKPLESTDFEALEDSITVVVKHPGAINDKYMGVCDYA